jgi:hypothetical protein
MANKDNPLEKMKEGVSVKEIENFSKRYLNEILLILAIIIATVSGMFDFFSGPGWSLGLAGLGAIVSILARRHVHATLAKFYGFYNKQEKAIQIILGVVRLIVALFLPFVVFFGVGLLAGIAIEDLNRTVGSSSREGEGHKKESSDEHEHI